MKEEYSDLHREWLQNPITQVLFKFLGDELEMAKEEWLAGKFVHDPMSGAQVLGKAQATEALLYYAREGIFIEEVQDELENSGIPGLSRA